MSIDKRLYKMSLLVYVVGGGVVVLINGWMAQRAYNIMPARPGTAKKLEKAWKAPKQKAGLP